MYSGGSVFDARPIALILSPLAGPDLTRSPEGCIHCCKHSTIALGGKHTAPLSLHKLPSGCMSFYRYNNHIFLISNLNHKSGQGYFCIFIGTCLRCLARLQAAMHCIGRLNRLHPRVRIPQPPLQTSRIGHRYMGAYIASMAAARQHSSPHSMPHEPVSPVKSATLPRPALDSPQNIKIAFWLRPPTKLSAAHTPRVLDSHWCPRIFKPNGVRCWTAQRAMPVIGIFSQIRSATAPVFGILGKGWPGCRLAACYGFKRSRAPAPTPCNYCRPWMESFNFRPISIGKQCGKES